MYYPLNHWIKTKIVEHRFVQCNEVNNIHEYAQQSFKAFIHTQIQSVHLKWNEVNKL